MASFATLWFEFRLPFSAPPKEASSFLSSSSTTIAPPPRQKWCPGGGGGGRRRRSECRLWQCLERSLQSYKKVGYQEGLRAAQAKNSNAGAREEEEESGENECEKRVFMFGMGYTCIALANTLQKQNWYVCKMLTERISKKNAHQQCCCCCDGDDDSLLCSSSRTHFFLDLFQASEFRSLDLWLCLWQAWTDGQSECSRLPCIHRWSIWCLAAAICLHCTDNHLSALCAHLIMYAWWFWVFPCWNCPG